MYGYSEGWPAPLKEAWTKCNRLDHKYRLLEANFVKIDFSEFEMLYRHYYPGMPGMSGCP